MLLLCAPILLFAVQHLQCGMAYPVWHCGEGHCGGGLSSVALWSVAFAVCLVWHCGEGGYCQNARHVTDRDHRIAFPPASQANFSNAPRGEEPVWRYEFGTDEEKSNF